VPRSVIPHLEHVHRLLRSSRDGVLRANGLNPARWAVLTRLSERMDAAGGELAQWSRVKHQTMFRTLERMEVRGLIERPGPVGPGFARRARITRKGTVLLESCQAALVEVEHHMLSRFDAEHADRFVQYLEECAARLERMPWSLTTAFRLQA
jgi:DNA-binding MarR family transcriptional regulator